MLLSFPSPNANHGLCPQPTAEHLLDAGQGQLKDPSAALLQSSSCGLDVVSTITGLDEKAVDEGGLFTQPQFWSFYALHHGHLI